MPTSKNKMDGSKNALQQSRLKAKGDIRVGDNVDNSRRTNVTFSFSTGKTIIVSISLAVLISAAWLLINSDRYLVTNRTSSTSQNSQDTAAINPPIPLENKGKSTIKTVEKKETPRDKDTTVQPSKQTIDKLSNYIDVNRKVAIAFYQPNQLKLINAREKIFEQLKSNGLKVSNAYFRPAFMKKFTGPLDGLDFTVLTQLSLQDKLNCICQITENIITEKSEQDGYEVWTAKGKLILHTYDFREGTIISTPLNLIPSPAMSEAAAITAAESYLLTSGKINNITLTHCK